MKEKLNNALNDIDRRFIEEAALADRSSGHASKIFKIILIPAAAAAVVALCLFALKKPQPGGVDLIQPPPAASEVHTPETETAESIGETTEGDDQEDHSWLFSCDDHTHIACDTENAEVTATAPGTLVFTGELPEYGKTAMISEQDGTFRLYCHLGGYLASPGDVIDGGEAFAEAGCPEGSDQLVIAQQVADIYIRAYILNYYGNIQNEDIGAILSDSGVNSGFDKEAAQALRESGVLPLDTLTLTDRNTQVGWQSGQYFWNDFFSEEMSNGVPVEVHSYQTGTVIKVSEGWNDGLGDYIIIDHGAGLATVYGHLGEIRVSEGQTVERSEVIAMTGSTGYTGKYGNILHFEIRENGTAMVEISVSENDDDGQYPEHDPEEENRIVAEICRRGSEYDQIGAQLLIRDSVMPLDEENMLVTAENGYDEWRGGMHYGVDLSGMNGSSQVYSYQSGVVLEAAGDGWNYGMGSYIVLDHGSGLVTVYAHLGRVDVSEGEQVEKGEIIGMTGETGYSTGIHLHFEIRENGEISPVMDSLTDSAGDEQTAAPETSFIWPVGGEDGGVISEPMYGYGGYYDHNGIDIAALAGTEVFAAGSGRVFKAEWYEGYGKCVMIDHGDGLMTLYGHLGEINVTEGQEVLAGDVIAGVGHTGQTTTCILHFEVRLNDEQVDPTPYLPWHKVVDISG